MAGFYENINGDKALNLAIKKHINRFPERFMFRLHDYEYDNLWFQIKTSSLENACGGRQKLISFQYIVNYSILFCLC